MYENTGTYRETLFQWIWEQVEFDCQNLKTTCGKRVTIIEPGVRNHGAGPDFLQAHLVIDGLTWHGSVEIHKTTSGWNAHQHNEDENFNNVILHVVYIDKAQKKVLRKDGTEPPTLCLQPYLHKSLHQLLAVQNNQTLPCGRKIPFISQQAFRQQINIAHEEYFDVKVNELLTEYNPHIPPSEAWKHMLITGLYSALGIPANRTQMKQLAQYLIESDTETPDLEAFLQRVKTAADLETNIRFSWIQSGMRPASLPAKRIPQAAALHFMIHHQPFKNILHSGVSFWDELLSKIPRSLLAGTTRLSILRNTVFLPAVFLLGDLFHSEKLKQHAYSSWDSSPQPVPNEVQKPFREAGFSIPANVKKLGLAHQYKRYCIKHQCQGCKVFKNAIRS